MQCDLTALKSKWPSAYVARREVGIFTGGMISPGTVANADCKEEGPQGAIRVGRNVAYPVESFIAWLETRVSVKRGDMSKVRAGKKRTRLQ